jgi:hypothetical protein
MYTIKDIFEELYVSRIVRYDPSYYLTLHTNIFLVTRNVTDNSEQQWNPGDDNDERKDEKMREEIGSPGEKAEETEEEKVSIEVTHG